MDDMPRTPPTLSCTDSDDDSPVNKKCRESLEIPQDSELRCSVCSKAFSCVSSRRKHERNVHRFYKENKKTSNTLLCNECGDTFSLLRTLRNHLSEVHGMENKKFNYEFASENDFNAWKIELEKNIGVQYSLRRNAYKHRDNTTSRCIYYCRRSGKIRYQGKDIIRKRAMKSTGSCKLDQYCTSCIEVDRIDGKVVVGLYANHYGHEVNLESFIHNQTQPKIKKDKIAGKLPKIEKDKIAGKLPKIEKDKIAGGEVNLRVSAFAMIIKRIDCDKIFDCVGDARASDEIFPDRPKSPQLEVSLYQEVISSDESVLERTRNNVCDIYRSLLPKIMKVKDVEVLRGIKNHLERAIDIIDTSSAAFEDTVLPNEPSTSKEPANTNVVRQDSFLSTEKRKILENSNLKTASVRPKNELKKILSIPQLDTGVPLISQGQICEEHNYYLGPNK